MRKGEKATLVAGPDYAYGETGAGDLIPGNSTLYFDVELVDFGPKPKEVRKQYQTQHKIVRNDSHHV